VKLTYLKDKLGERVPNLKGDLLVLRSNFKVNRADYGINPRRRETSGGHDRVDPEFGGGIGAAVKQRGAGVRVKV